MQRARLIKYHIFYCERSIANYILSIIRSGIDDFGDIGHYQWEEKSEKFAEKSHVSVNKTKWWRNLVQSIKQSHKDINFSSLIFVSNIFNVAEPHILSQHHNYHFVICRNEKSTWNLLSEKGNGLWLSDKGIIWL